MEKFSIFIVSGIMRVAYLLKSSNCILESNAVFGTKIIPQQGWLKAEYTNKKYLGTLQVFGNYTSK